MLTLKIGEKELKIKYGYEATLKTKLLSRMAKKEKLKENNENSMEATEDLLLFLPEFLLIGLQKFHADEYGFNYETGEGKQEQLDKVFLLIEECFDNNEEIDAINLYNLLTKEMLENGFLRSQFQKELSNKKNSNPETAEMKEKITEN